MEVRGWRRGAESSRLKAERRRTTRTKGEGRKEVEKSRRWEGEKIGR